MSEKTKIEWTAMTWNPWVGCQRVSPGCLNCYMFAMERRWGRDATKRRRTSVALWRKPLAWNRACNAERPRVFPSMCDWLDPEVPASWLADFLELVWRTPALDWLLLTKRPQLWRSRIRAASEVSSADMAVCLDAWLEGVPPANVWVGASAEDQKRLDARMVHLMRIPARLRFLSCEPLLGPLDLHLCKSGFLHRDEEPSDPNPKCETWRQQPDWVIVGGESHPCRPKARPCEVGWIRSVVEQCRSAKTPCFVKQTGSRTVDPNAVVNAVFPKRMCWPSAVSRRTPCGETLMRLVDPKGGDMKEWPADLRVRQFPEVKP